MLIVKYERKNFFGCYQYTEDNKENYQKEDLKKAFLFLGKKLFCYNTKGRGYLLLGQPGRL